MFRLLIFSFVIFISTVSHAQKCRYEIETVDADTELQVKRTEPVDVIRVNNQPFLIKAQCIGARKYMKIRYYRYNGFEIRSAESIEIIFTDDSSIKITAREMPNTRSGNGFVQVSSMLVYDLTPEQYLQLLNKPACAIKYYIEGSGFIRTDIRKKLQSEIQHIMKCVLLDTDNF